MAKQPARKAPAQKRAGFNDVIIIGIVGVVVIALAFVYQSFNTDGFNLKTDKADAETGTVTEIYAVGDVRINEVMSANDSAYYTQDGESADWVEVMNIASGDVNLAGYVIAKKVAATDQFVFPDMILKSGECALVFCDSRNRNTAGYELHAPFSISRAGDTLMLFNAAGTAIDSANVPDLSNNESYARADVSAWEKTAEYTPSLPNTRENHLSFATVMIEGPIEITEVMAKNVTYAPDASGLYYDYIELHNASAAEVDLSGYHLSDSADDLMKWTFPAGTKIPANGYRIVYASGLQKAEGSELHATFKLSTEGESVVLSNARGQMLDRVDYGLLRADEAFSKGPDGSFTNTIPPTPGMANTQESAALISDRFAAFNTVGVYITEIAASTTEAKYDWVELYNATGSAIDLSGYGLSDDAGKPRKWCFPAGTAIQAGGYLGVFLSGLTGAQGLNADFRLSAGGGYNLCLATPEGAVFDRTFVPLQHSDITYGRLPGEYGRFYYFTKSSPGADNTGAHYARKAPEATYSVPGGLYGAGEVLTVELSAEPGDRIYYTTDWTDPDESSTPYTGPITISANTILRTRVYADDALESYMSCQSYFFGLSHTMRVVSLVSDPYNLTSEEAGIMIKGPNATDSHPYGHMNFGANFWMDWEREAHVEVYEADGTQALSQECGIKLHGQFSRANKQQAFKIYARNQYSGDSRFPMAIFADRGYTEYKSFLLRASGQDWNKTRMRDSVLTSLATETSVFYQETELCVLYINGRYWGQYNMREHINTHSICQFEGWEGQEDDIDLIKANTNVMQGSNDSYAALLEWVNTHDTNTDEAYARIGSVIDIRNFIEYVSLQIFTGNTDTLNVKRYRNANDDGLWRWVLFDLDWAFYTDTDSLNRWLTPGGVGNENRTNNDLFVACMKNDRFRDEFLSYFGEQLATTFSTQNMLRLIKERYDALLPEMEMQLERFGPSMSEFNAEVKKIVDYAKKRPSLILERAPKTLGFTDAQMRHYFGAAYQAVEDYKNSGK